MIHSYTVPTPTPPTYFVSAAYILSCWLQSLLGKHVRTYSRRIASMGERMSSEEEPMASPTTFRATNKKKEKKKKCELIGYEALPEWLKDNEFIHGYYRCEWPMKETILSVFSVHNETLNVWSHLMGFLLFLCLTVLTAAVIPRDNSSSSRDRLDDASSMRSYWGDLMAVANVKQPAASCSLQLLQSCVETRRRSQPAARPTHPPHSLTVVLKP